jgi:hypothetical protein
MIRWQTARHEVAMFGRVVDFATRKPVAGALVEIHGKSAGFDRKLQLVAMQYGDRWATMMERPDRTITRNDGQFHFMDLADGQYTLRVTYPSAGRRYGRTEQSVEVSHDPKKRVRIEIALPVTVVKGKIAATGQKGGVAMAEVRMKGSGERTFSDVHGQYSLSAVEPGKRTVMVLAQGFGPASQVVSVPEPGALETLNFNLAREGR